MAVLRPGERPRTRGTRPPLPALPRTPAMRGYVHLHATLTRLAFRHAADVLRPPAPATSSASAVFGTLPKAETDDGFRVLDGLWFPGRGGSWVRVDLPYVREARRRWLSAADDRALAAAALVDTLETLVRDDAMGLRRLVLWEVCAAAGRRGEADRRPGRRPRGAPRRSRCAGRRRGRRVPRGGRRAARRRDAERRMAGRAAARGGGRRGAAAARLRLSGRPGRPPPGRARGRRPRTRR
ncbi:hypothetical protein SALBM135S_06093 [Streptomyces alboniger]